LSEAGAIIKPEAAAQLSGVRCENCVYWQPMEGVPTKIGQPKAGQCKRNPPMPMVTQGADALGRPAMQLQAVFPPTYSTEWCGEFSDSDDGE
jgi:hypothetical protein